MYFLGGQFRKVQRLDVRPPFFRNGTKGPQSLVRRTWDIELCDRWRVVVTLRSIGRRSVGLKMAKKCWLYLDIFSCVKINVFRSFFALRLEMHVRCDNRYKTGADRGNTFGQPMLFECLGICVLLLPWLCAYCKILISFILFKFSHSILDWTALSWKLGGIF